MPTSVETAMAAAGLGHSGVVAWGTPLPEARGGIYVISLSNDPSEMTTLNHAPISTDRVRDLIEKLPGITLDRRRPSPEQLERRIRSMWLADETALYIGKATNLGSRVRQYYTTPVGARSPHAGGWPLKMLSVLDRLWVHWAIHDMPELAEQQALAEFVRNVSADARTRLHDPSHPYPYANLEGPGGRKHHGIGGARAPRRDAARSDLGKGGSEPTALDRQRSNDQPSPGANVTLHEEIKAILLEHANSWMTLEEIASEVADRQRYRKRDGTSNVTAFQVHGRTKNYPHLFERNGNRVRLRDTS